MQHWLYSTVSDFVLTIFVFFSTKNLVILWVNVFSSVKSNNCAIVLEIHDMILGAPVGICSNGQWEVGNVFFLFFFGNFFAIF